MITHSRRRIGTGHAIAVGFSALFLSSFGGAQPPDYPPSYPEYPEYPPYPSYPPNPHFPPYPNVPPDSFHHPYDMVPSASGKTTHVNTPWSWGAQLGSTVIDETNTTTLLLSPQINVAYRLAVAWNLIGTWSFSALVDSQGLGEASLRAGNPLFAAGYGRTQLNRPWKATFGVTLPIVRIPSDYDGRLYTFLVNHNLAMNGMWNAWLWLRDYIALPVQGSLTFPLPYSIPMTLAGGIAPLIGVRKQKSDQDLMAQISVAVEIPAFQRIHFSPRWQLVLLPSTSLDRLQSAAAIRASYIASQSRYFIEVLFNLDEPLGMLRGLERWGLWLGKEMDP